MNGIELANTGDHPALNFVNTRMRPRGRPVDLLESGVGLLDWMVSSELLDDADRRLVESAFSTQQLDAAAEAAREWRESLRDAIGAWATEGATGLSASVLTRINDVLARDNRYDQLELSAEGSIERVGHRRWDTADQLTIPVVAAVADLFGTGNPDLVRACDGPRCTLWFYDRTKSHRRRWCSQAVCGNRDKVRNHRARAQSGGA